MQESRVLYLALQIRSKAKVNTRRKLSMHIKDKSLACQEWPSVIYLREAYTSYPPPYVVSILYLTYNTQSTKQWHILCKDYVIARVQSFKSPLYFFFRSRKNLTIYCLHKLNWILFCIFFFTSKLNKRKFEKYDYF